MKLALLLGIILLVIFGVAGAQLVSVTSSTRAPKTYKEHLAAVKRLLVPGERKPSAAAKPPPVES